MEKSNNYRAGFVAIVGYPNAGKSTLLNALIGEKISIVTAKPQTTRNKITGVYTAPEGQIVFVDTPGLLKSHNPLHDFLDKELDAAVRECDVVVALVEWGDEPKRVLALADRLKNLGARDIVWVANKTDLQKPESSWTRSVLEDADVTLEHFISCHPSKKAVQKDILAAMAKAVIAKLPNTPGPLYPEDDLTTMRSREMVGEIVREKCLENLDQEIPYQLAIKIQAFDEGRTPIRIAADIVLDRESHKGIVLGQKGSMIQKIGSSARKDIEHLLGDKVFLELHVVVKSGWMKNRDAMRDLGYVVQETR